MMGGSNEATCASSRTEPPFAMPTCICNTMEHWNSLFYAYGWNLMCSHEVAPVLSCSLNLQGFLVFTLAVCCRWAMAEDSEVDVVICTLTTYLSLDIPLNISFVLLTACLVCEDLECTCGNGDPRLLESYIASWCFHSLRFEKTTLQHTFPKASEHQNHYLQRREYLHETYLDAGRKQASMPLSLIHCKICDLCLWYIFTFSNSPRMNLGEYTYGSFQHAFVTLDDESEHALSK